LILYAIPTPLGASPEQSLPAPALATIRSLKDFAVENAKSARAFLGALGMQVRALNIQVIDDAHDLLTPHPGWAESDPDAWWANAVACIRRVGQDVPLAEVASVGVSGMVPALVLLGAGNHPLRPSIQQNDGRTGEEIAALRARLDGDAFFAATGQPFSQQLIGPKLLWLARHESAVAGAIRRVLGSYDYVTWRLAGEWSLEQNWALESGLWDARQRDWYRPALHAARSP